MGDRDESDEAEKAFRNEERQRKMLFTAGRPPWYDPQGQSKDPFLIGVGGGSASGKTTVASKIIEALSVPWVVLLSMDSFYKVLNEEEQERAGRGEYDFDCPDAFDFELLIETFEKLKEGKNVQIPIYDFSTHSRSKAHRNIYGGDVVIFEGILAFANRRLTELMDMKVFVDTDADTRLSRRLRRDIAERGRDLQSVLHQYKRFVKPAFDQFIAPMMRHADIVVPRGGENEVAIDLIVQHVQKKLKERGEELRSKLVSAYQGQKHPNSLHQVPSTPQIQGIHTTIRNRDTIRDEFVFYSKRLARILIEYALTFLPFEPTEVKTSQRTIYKGCKFKGQVCGVSILRAGETIEPALKSVCKDVKIGNILIQTNPVNDEPELHFKQLPRDISQYHVILMDATIATGAAALMAIRVLLDHDVRPENILLVTLIAAELGIHTVAYAFPEVKIITTAVDPIVNEQYHIVPGIGNFGDRIFGTGDW